MKAFNVLFLSLILAVLVHTSVQAIQEPQHHHDDEQFGAVSFPVSCAANVQAPFERGVAILHSFEYESAATQFQEIEKTDPACAMAYWGEAMSLYHQLWDRPSQASLARGAELMAKARRLKAPTRREGDYIHALSVFYRDSEKLGHAQRAAAYSKAMRRVYRRNPQDREAAVFYALSILASDSGDADLSHAKAAVAILNKLYDEEPNHPGIAHYIIHGCDNPHMASLALPAARKYASIAPSSPHAVHMPSHIFARLGLWQDDIRSNLAAIHAADTMSGHHHVLHHKVHSMDYLEYAYLQIGDDENAKAMVDQLGSLRVEDMDPEFRDYLLARQAESLIKYAIERRQWKDALAIEPAAGVLPNVALVTFWGRTLAAGHLHNSAAAQDSLKHYEELLDALRKSSKAYIADALKNEHQVVQAWASYAAGKPDEGLRLLRAVADEQDKVGKGETELPAREMLADMLMDMNRPEQALAEYEIDLRTDPNRFNGLYGAAEAATMIQQKQKAAGYYAQLLKNCEGIRSDRPELEQARTLLAENK